MYRGYRYGDGGEGCYQRLMSSYVHAYRDQA